MSLRFILGRAGSGKSRAVLQELAAAARTGRRSILLVPEQATLQAERELAGRGAVEVFSFRRLAWRVLQEAGGAARPHLGELGKRMALRALLERRKEELSLFGRAAARPGFTERLAHTVAELRIYRVEPAALERAWRELAEAGRGETVLAGKLHDLSLVYADLEDYLAGRYIDPDDYLALLAERLPEAGLARGAMVWVDGFSGFTPQELAVLEALLRAARQVNVALCLDPAGLQRPHSEADLFHPTGDTYRRLNQVAARTGAGVEEPLRLAGPPCRFRQSALVHLERAWDSWPAQPFSGEPEGFRLVSAANRRVEVEAAARAMIRLARQQGWRWREMAVLVRDLEPYQDLLQKTLRAFGIPFFLDSRRSIAQHPLPELLRSALDVLLENWSYDPVFRCLKTDLALLARDSVDRLENYVLEHGLRGKRWVDPEPWSYRRRLSLEEEDTGRAGEEELRRLDAARRRAAAPLAALEERLAGAPTARQVTDALYQLLLDLRVPRRLEIWQRRAQEEGDPDAVQEHAQAWQGVLEVLEQLVEALGDEVLPLAEYARVLEAGLEGLRLGLIPPALDQVVVGSLERSRQPEVQAVFLLGAGEGMLPARLAEDEVLGDGEREELAGRGLELAPPASLRLLHEQYLVYLGLTRSASFLWLSYPRADEEGRALAPSPVLRRLRQLFPTLAERDAEEEDPLEALATPAQAAADLIAAVRRLAAEDGGLPPFWLEVYRFLAGQAEWRAGLARLTASLGFGNASSPLPAELAASLYGLPLAASVSRLEAFARCPFAHLAQYGLRLKERATCRVDAPDLGQFLHAALRRFVERLSQRGLDWGKLPPAEGRELAQAVTAELAPLLEREVLAESSRHHYLQRRLGRIVLRAVEALGEHARRGQFRPLAVEVAFGLPGGLPGVPLELPGGRHAELGGRIDRVDGAFLDGRWLMRVLDYKMTAPAFTLQRVEAGLSLQLPLYLWAACELADKLAGGPADPAGLFYFALRDPVLRLPGPPDPQELERQRLRQLRLSGLVLSDPVVVKLMDGEIQGYSDLLPVELKKDGGLGARSRALDRASLAGLLDAARRQATASAGAMLDGRAGINPYRDGGETACSRCRFRPVCQFDPQLPGNSYREMRGLGMEGEGGGTDAG